MEGSILKTLIIIGAGGHGRVCADVARKMGVWEEILFADDHAPESFPYPIVGNTDEAAKREADFFVAIGNASIRKRVTAKLKSVVTLIHPSAVIGERAVIGEGTLIAAGAVVAPDAVIGKGAIVNTQASVDHDCVIGDYVHVSVGAHLCGTVHVGENTWIGAGATVINNIDICPDCFIGAGAVAVKSITVPGTYIGVPAKEKR